MTDHEPKVEPKVIDAEVVHNGLSHEAEHVSVSRIQSNRWFRKLLPPEEEQEEGRKGLRDMRFRLWVWLVGLLVVAGGCFYGAVSTDVVIWSAFLLIAGAASVLGAGTVGFLIWAFHRLLPK